MSSSSMTVSKNCQESSPVLDPHRNDQAKQKIMMTERPSVKPLRIKAKRDIWISLGYIFIFAVFIFSLIIVPAHQRWIIWLMVLPVSVFLVWLFFGTFYVFGEKVLICQSGPFREKIPYEKIRSLKLCENLMSSMALSRKRIEIRQISKGFVTGTTYISPVDREQFMDELVSRCPNLENRSP